MDNEDQALVQSLNALVNAMSEKDPKMLVDRVQMLEDQVDDLEEQLELSFKSALNTYGAMVAMTELIDRQEKAIKHLIWNKPEQALAALRGELKDVPNVNTDPI